MTDELIALIDQARAAAGYLSVLQTARLSDRGNVVLDPFSILISPHVTIGSGNLFNPSVILGGSRDAPLVIGNSNRFYGGTLIVAETGPIVIGDGNQFGEGGFTARANRPGASIQIGSGGRYVGGSTVLGRCRLGNGSQILGMITADGVELGDGEPHTDPDPDTRGGVLKGSGLARGIRVNAGEVVVGDRLFRQQDIQRQFDFHPKPLLMAGGPSST
jgi:hypothetical protein